MESQTGSPTSPSAIFTEPRTPNSWTVRSFTTLGPSDSPSQAQFPKHSQASLLLGPQRERARATGGIKEASPAKKQLHQPSFLKRNFRFIALAVMFQIAIAGITTMVVLIIAAAKSKPPKRIKPGYYTGLMLSFACGIASIILGYVKWNERKTSSPGEGTCPGVNELNGAEFGLVLSPLPPRSPMDDTRAIVSNWEHSTPAARHHHLNTLMATGNPLPSASARIAGSSNRPFPQPPFITDRGIELASLSPYPRHHHQRHEPATDTALELQRFIDHELQRQELIKRRISAWLHDL
ncbi:MAG: hypothetical protein Q9188_006452, partial [Gyalolechia gomerana]